MTPDALRSGEYMEDHCCMPDYYDQPHYNRHCNACGYLWWAGRPEGGPRRGTP
jgi:hypothetical protein